MSSMLGIEVFLIMIIKQQRTKNILADAHLQVTLPLTIFVRILLAIVSYEITRMCKYANMQICN